MEVKQDAGEEASSATKGQYNLSQGLGLNTADIRRLDWDWVKRSFGPNFDLCIIDAPWSLVPGEHSRVQPCRGVQLSYESLTVAELRGLPIPSLVPNGFLLLWFI